MSSSVAQGASNPWSYVQTEDEYYDFNKELYRLPDKGNTIVNLELTFDTDSLTAYYTVFLSDDSGNPVALERPTGRSYLPWGVALEMLGDEVEIPVELTSLAPSAQAIGVAVKALVPAEVVSQAYSYAALASLSRDVSACSEFDVIFKGLHTPEGLAGNEIAAIVDALDFQRTGKPDFICKRSLATTVARKLEGAYDVRLNIGGPAKFRFLDQAEIDVIVASLDSLSKARESTFLKDGIGDLGRVLFDGYYSEGYPWQNGYDKQVSGASVAMDGLAIRRAFQQYEVNGMLLRDAIRHAEIVGDPVPFAAYERLQTLTAEASVSKRWADPSFRESQRTGNTAVMETHLHGLSLPHVGEEQVAKLKSEAQVDEAHVHHLLGYLCLTFNRAAVKQSGELRPLLLADEFVHETLRRAAGVWEYVSWAKDDPFEAFRTTFHEAMRMWAVAHVAAERPESLVGLNVFMRCGEDPYFNGHFGAGAARWEPATFIAGNQFVAAHTDGNGLTHLVLFTGDSDPQKWLLESVCNRAIDGLHAQPDFDGQFGSLLIERGFPKQVSPELAKSALEVIKAHCNDITDSRDILYADVLGFKEDTEVKHVLAWLSEHGATPEPVVDTKKTEPDNGPSAP